MKIASSISCVDRLIRFLIFCNLYIEIFFRFYLFFKSNLFLQVSETELQPGKRIPLTDIGAGCYPTTIFFNHSCAPNTVRINQGKRVCHHHSTQSAIKF